MIQASPQLIKEEEVNKIYKNIINKDDLDNYLYFSIVLPFHLGLPEKHCITIKDEEDDQTYSFLFQTYEYTLNKEKHFVSSVNMFLFNKKFKNKKEKSRKVLSDTFDYLLDRLNTVIFSYKYVAKTPYLYEINVTDLDLMVFYGAKVGGVKLKVPGLLVLDVMNIKTKQKILNKQEFYEFTRIHALATSQLNPFVDVKRMFLYAHSLGIKRRYSESILMGQTAFERMLYEILKVVYPELSEENYENIPFKQKIIKYMPEKLGGNWSIIEGTRGAVSEYFNKPYKLRCKIIHNGYKPNSGEYNEAMKKTEEMVKFILQRIKAKKEQYPELARMWSV